MNDLGRRLAEAKKKSGLTWRHIAIRSGYSESFLQCIARGRKTNMTVHAVACVAETLNVRPAWLAGWEE